ncbi:hypothetical protein D3C77_272980 [compost metagenome]
MNVFNPAPFGGSVPVVNPVPCILFILVVVHEVLAIGLSGVLFIQRFNDFAFKSCIGQVL